MPRHELVICTKDRPEELDRCLGSIGLQAILPDRVLIVDSSPADASRVVASRWSSLGPFAVEYVRAEPGLTRQRNIALEHLRPETEFVHFVDDDAVLDPCYVSEILRALEAHPHASGAGGRITNLPPHETHWWRILGGNDSRREGVVLPSGVNILSFTGDRWREVDWLSGCSMSFRVEHIEGLRFNESRTGNGLGEDVDFCLRAQRRGPLIWSPFALVEHLQSPINRDNALLLHRRVIVSRWKFAQDGLGQVRRHRVVASALSDTAILLSKALRFRSRTNLLSAKSTVDGLLDIARARELH